MKERKKGWSKQEEKKEMDERRKNKAISYYAKVPGYIFFSFWELSPFSYGKSYYNLPCRESVPLSPCNLLGNSASMLPI